VSLKANLGTMLRWSMLYERERLCGRGWRS